MSIKKYLYIGIGLFLLIVVLAVGITAEFKLSNITDDVYAFIDEFFSRWSLALSAAGTIILGLLVFFNVYEGRRREEKEKEQAIHALHEEIHSILTDFIEIRFGISRRLEEHGEVAFKGLSRPMQEYFFPQIDTFVFDNMKNAGQLHWLQDMRMDVVFCYRLIRMYNRGAVSDIPNLDLLIPLPTKIYERLEKAIRDLEAKFKFLPHYTKEKSQGQQTKQGNDITGGA